MIVVDVFEPRNSYISTGKGKLHFIAARDSKEVDMKTHFLKTFELIEGNKNGATLVACFAGQSRSATIVVAYLMKKFKWKLEQALRFVKERRKIHPNQGFLSQLKLYEKEIFN